MPTSSTPVTAPNRMESTATTSKPSPSAGRTPAYGLRRALTGMDQFLELEHVLARAGTDIHQVMLLDPVDAARLHRARRRHAREVAGDRFLRSQPVVAEVRQEQHVR